MRSLSGENQNKILRSTLWNDLFLKYTQRRITAVITLRDIKIPPITCPDGSGIYPKATIPYTPLTIIRNSNKLNAQINMPRKSIEILCMQALQNFLSRGPTISLKDFLFFSNILQTSPVLNYRHVSTLPSCVYLTDAPDVN